MTKIAVVGATGMVGRVMLDVLREQSFDPGQIQAVASERSVGQSVTSGGHEYPVIGMEEAIALKPDIALFSAGGDTSLKYAPIFAKAGIRVIDNSSAWRMSPDHKLIVPEINGDSLTEQDMIIANPNCSTVQLVMVLAPLHRKYGVKRVIVSTYQSVSGTGKEAVEQMNRERMGAEGRMVYPYPIDRNCIPHCDVFEENGYTKEEMKLTRETKKIIGDDSILVSATAVRVPVVGGHSESVNITLAKSFELGDIRKMLHDTPGVTLQDNPDVLSYPMPLYASGKNDVFVGRIRKDFSFPDSLNMWIVADNLRKGAATNAVQIAQHLIARGWA